jgi:membrane-associated phospholipid phosphatase
MNIDNPRIPVWPRSPSRLFWLCLLVLSLAAWAAQSEPTTDRTGWLEAARADLGVFGGYLKADAKATFFDAGNLAALAGAGLASVAMNDGDADEDVADYFARHDTFEGFSSEALFVIGNPISHFAGTALWYVLSAEKHDDPSREQAVTMLSALTVTAAVTGGLKAIRHNDQPDGGPWAWPSGHASSSVAVASVLHEFYGLKVGLPAYAVAGAVAWRMMDEGDHWASDVLFGATLGWVIGHTVAHRHGTLEIAGFEVLPYLGRPEAPAVGLSLAKVF